MNNSTTVGLQSVSFKYDPGAADWIMRHFDLEVDSTDRLAVYGPNGCGKSTLLYLLAGLLAPVSGKRAVPCDMGTGFVFQDYTRSLLNWYTVAENLDLATRTHPYTVPHKVALKDMFGGPPPDWIVRALPRYPYQLSGGQRQLISILRALLGQPRMLFLDEPFASLDIGHKKMAVELLQHTKGRGAGWMVIAHELDDCLLTADRIFVVQGPPLHVVRTVEVPLEWPRSYQALGAAAVQAARKDVYEILW